MSKILLVVEGEKVEKELFEHFYKLYQLNNVQIVAYKTNIYHFYNRLKKDFSNASGEIEYEFIDLPLFLNDYLNLEEEQKLNTYDFKDKILIFDFDPHDPQYSEAKIMELIENFSNSTDLGKLYINYPMIESYKDIENYNVDEFVKRTIHIDDLQKVGRLSGYKKIVDKRTCIKRIRDIDETIANQLFQLNREKFEVMVNEPYIEAENHDKLCEIQCQKLATTREIAVINTSILHLYDEYGEIK